MVDTAKITAEWLAGFFDGEGCVSIKRATKSSGWALRVNLTQANYELLKAIADKYSAGYGPYAKVRKTKNGKESTVYEIGWSGKNAYDILKLLQGRVIVKARQVELALEFITTLVGSGNRFTVAVAEQRDSIVERMRYLNHAGPFKPAAETEGVIEKIKGDVNSLVN